MSEIARRPSCLIPGPRKYEVTRGVRFDEISFRRTLTDIIFTGGEQDMIEFGRRLERDGEQNFGGVLFSNKFRVNAPILLNGLGFFGPMVDDGATYKVTVQVYEALKRNTLPIRKSRQIMNMTQRVYATRGTIFNVDFPNPLRIKPHFWYDVKFCLDGPNTCRCETTYEQVSVQTPIGELLFDFIEGSKQLPKLHFSLC